MSASISAAHSRRFQILAITLYSSFPCAAQAPPPAGAAPNARQAFLIRFWLRETMPTAMMSTRPLMMSFMK